MTTSQEPLGRAFTLSASPIVVPAPGDLELAARARTAGLQGRDEEAQAVLAGMPSDAAVAPPDELEPALLDLAAEEGHAPAVWAEAWAAVGRLRSGRHDREGEIRAREAALAHAPTAGRMRDLAEAWEPLDAGHARRLLDEGFARWPDAVNLWVGAGEAALRRGELDEARDALAQALARDRDDPDALLALARLELAAGSPEDALVPARRASPERPASARGLLVVAWARTGRLADHPDLLDAVVTDPPLDVWTLKRIAEILAGSGRAKAAEAMFDRALAVAPDDLEGLYGRGLVRALLGRPALAEDDLERVATLLDAAGIANTTVTAWRGEVARQQGDDVRAVEFLASVECDEEAPPWVPAAWGHALLGTGDVSGAQAAFERALHRDADDAWALRGLGRLFLDGVGAQDLDAAETVLRRARDLAPGDVSTEVLLGEVLQRTNRSAEAVEAFDRVLAQIPDDAYTLTRKGQAHRALRDVAGAVPALERAACLQPEAEWILDELVAALGDRDLASADKVLRRVQEAALDAGLDVFVVRTRRARVAARRRRWEKAERLYRSVRELRPADPTVLGEYAQLLVDRGRFLDALALLESAPAGTTDDDLRWSRIDLLWRLERLDEVESELEQLTASDAPATVALTALGELRRVQGRRDEARRLLRRAVAQPGSSVYARASLGALEWDDGRVVPARAELEAAVEGHPGYGFALVRLAWLEIDEGRADAVRGLLARIDEDPLDQQLVLARAFCLFGLAEYQRAVGVLEEFLEAAGDQAEVLRQRAWTDLAAGRPRHAVAGFLAATDVDDSPFGLVAGVEGLLRVDRWDDAVALLGRDGWAGLPALDLARTLVALHLGEWEAAAGTGRRAATRQPTSSAALTATARALRLSGLPHEALPLAQSAAELGPHDVVVAVEHAECLRAADRAGEARAAFEAVLSRLRRRIALDPDERLLLGRCLLRVGRSREAAVELLRALGAGDRTAVTLSVLVLARLVDAEHLREAAVLQNRFLDELTLLSPPTRCGLLAGAVADLDDLDDALPEESRERAGSLRALLVARHGELRARYDVDLVLSVPELTHRDRPGDIPYDLENAYDDAHDDVRPWRPTVLP